MTLGESRASLRGELREWRSAIDVVIFAPLAPVAQLDRAPGYEPGGREFESLRARIFIRVKSQDLGDILA
jgi:hypothetical protein